MTARFLKNIILPSFVVIAIACGGIFYAQAAENTQKKAQKNFTKEEIEKIVHDYITKDPQFILDAVNAHMAKSAQAEQQRADEGFKKNKDMLFKDSSSPETGNPQGDVTIVEFFDYNCGYCKHALPAVQALLEKDKNVRFIFRDFPILGPTSETAAKWALAAQKQKKYFEFHRALMENKTPINDALLEKISKDVGMDPMQAKKDAADPEISLQLDKNRALAGEMALTGTPAFIVGDQVFRGAISQQDMEKAVAEQRAKNAKK